MARSNRIAVYVLLSAVGLFGLGYGLAWFSEQSLFAAEVLPHKKNSPEPATVPPSPSLKPSVKPSALPSAVSQPSQKYSVKPGDTLSSIANAHSVDFQELAKINDIAPPYNLTVGQTITLPAKSQ